MATLTLTIAASTDDAALGDSGYTDNSTSNSAAKLVGGTGTTNAGHGQGWRFTGVTLTSGDTINSAYLSLLKDGDQWVQLDNRFTFQDDDNAAAFASGSPNRPGDRAIVASPVVDQSNVNHLDATRYNFPLVAGDKITFGARLASVLARGGWASGNAVAVLNNSDQDASAYTNFSRKNFHDYDSATASSEPQLVIDYTSAVAHARPTSDVSNAGSWTTDSGGTTSLYAAVDETSASDTDYIRSPTTPSSSVLELGLGSITDPALSTGHELRFRAQQTAAGPAYGLTVALYQASTQKATYSPAALTAAWADYSYTLTGGEADSITDYADLRLRFTATETPAAPTYVGSGTAVYTATSGQTLAPLPPTRAVGDKLVCVMVYGATTDISDSVTNWTKLASGTEDNTAMRTEVWWRDATNNATDNPTLPSFATTTVRGARIFAVRGAAAGAPTVARSNNAASTTVTFPAATATAATTLSVLAYGYEDDPSATTGNVSGFSAFDIDVSSLGNDMAIGMDATRTNSSSGSKAGGTCVVQTGTFAASVNTGLHFIFEPLVGTRAQVSWAEFVAPLAVGGGGAVLAGNSDGTSTVSATTLNQTQPLAASSTGTSATSATTLKLNHALAASSQGDSTASATALKLNHALAGSATGTSSTSATTLLQTQPLAGAATGTSTTSATTLVQTQPLAGSATGTSATSADLTVGSSGAVLAGSATGTSTATATTLLLNHALAGSATGTSTTTADLSAAGGAAVLAGSSTGTSSATATTLKLNHALAGSAQGDSTATATTLRLTHPLAGAATGTSSTTADLTLSGSTAALEGSATGTSSATATTLALVHNLTLFGSATGTSSATATRLTVPVSLHTSIAGNSYVESAQLNLSAHALAGTATGTSSATATITAIQIAAGSATGTSTVTGTLRLTGVLAGTSAGASTATGVLKLNHALTASSTGTSSTTGNLRMVHPLLGTATGTSTVTNAQLDTPATMLGLAVVPAGLQPGGARAVAMPNGGARATVMSIGGATPMSRKVG